jgi:hypothetical protein
MDLNPMFRLWKNFFFQHFVMCSTLWVHESGWVDYGLELWDSCKIKKLPQPWHVCTTIFNLKDQDMFAQLFYTIDTFPYDDAMTIWINKKN